LELVYFEILDQFNYLSFEIRGFSHFNQILLSLFDISSTFLIGFDLTLKQKGVIHYKQLKYNPEMHTKYQINLTKFD